ncbi:YacL family protein [Neiella marina]|uniref:YacL family protein n=1 Tax=Neiella holothuriorum TaxID=2870530 RepID=A0ABS7EJ20_9GAMM|nr:YacL family protein [Neiella holothuriorum]MBW8192325.1 YacL family protein [Neiella holothuriorum]
MDYEFSTNVIDGTPVAKVDDPQSAFGTWLTSEVGLDIPRVKALLKLLESTADSWQEEGREWLLECESGDIQLAHHSMTCDDEMPLSGENDLRDDHENLSAEAGLEDFCALLTSWFHHISS